MHLWLTARFFMKTTGAKRKFKLVAVLAAMGAATAIIFMATRRAGAEFDNRSATVVRKTFRQTIHRAGKMQPVKEEHIICRISGQITELVPQGSTVAAGQVVLRLDATPYEDQKLTHEAYISSLEAQFKREQLTAEKALNQAIADVASYELGVKLEHMRLLDLKKGPSASDAVTAHADVENSKVLFTASGEDVSAHLSLLEKGYVSRDIVRAKQLGLKEQELKVDLAQISEEKLNVLDEVKLADQELKVRDMEKTCAEAAERMALLKQNLARDNESRALTLKREYTHLQQLVENIEKTVYRAPLAGTVIHKPGRYYNYQPGRDVTDSAEVMAITDNSRMKVSMTVDEARISNVVPGLKADVIPVGWDGPPFSGKVTRVAAKGRDEFEQYADETTAITGAANRQVFDVDVELDDTTSAFIPGLNVDVDIILQSMDALQIPRAAIFRNAANETIVFVAHKDASETRTIKVLVENQFEAAVEGVKEGESVRLVSDGNR